MYMTHVMHIIHTHVVYILHTRVAHMTRAAHTHDTHIWHTRDIRVMYKQHGVSGVPGAASGLCSLGWVQLIVLAGEFRILITNEVEPMPCNVRQLLIGWRACNSRSDYCRWPERANQPLQCSLAELEGDKHIEENETQHPKGTKIQNKFGGNLLCIFKLLQRSVGRIANNQDGVCSRGQDGVRVNGWSE